MWQDGSPAGQTRHCTRSLKPDLKTLAFFTLQGGCEHSFGAAGYRGRCWVCLFAAEGGGSQKQQRCHRSGPWRRPSKSTFPRTGLQSSDAVSLWTQVPSGKRPRVLSVLLASSNAHARVKRKGTDWHGGVPSCPPPREQACGALRASEWQTCTQPCSLSFSLASTGFFMYQVSARRPPSRMVRGWYARRFTVARTGWRSFSSRPSGRQTRSSLSFTRVAPLALPGRQAPTHGSGSARRRAGGALAG